MARQSIDGQNTSLAKSLLAGWMGDVCVHKMPGWMHRKGTASIVGNVPIGKVIHFKNAAARAKADKALTALKSKGGEISPEDLARVVAPHTHSVPLWRGAEKSTVARITEILAPKKETTDVPSK